jgi:hypothetical protein
MVCAAVAAAGGLQNACSASAVKLCAERDVAELDLKCISTMLLRLNASEIRSVTSSHAALASGIVALFVVKEQKRNFVLR